MLYNIPTFDFLSCAPLKWLLQFVQTDSVLSVHHIRRQFLFLSYVRFVKVTVLCLSFMQWVCFKQCTLNSDCPNKAWKRNLWIVLLIKIAKIFCLCLELSGYGRYLPESAVKDQVKYTVCYLLHIGFIKICAVFENSFNNVMMTDDIVAWCYVTLWLMTVISYCWKVFHILLIIS